MSLEEVEVAAPGPGQVRIRQTAIGVNFIDVYHRTGLYPLTAAVRPRQRGRRRRHRRRRGRDARSRPATASPTRRRRRSAAYADERLVDAKMARQVAGQPSRARRRAAMMLKGLTAQYLLRRTLPVEAGRYDPFSRRGRRRRPHRLPVGQASSARRVIGTVGSRGEGGARARQRLRARHPLPRRGLRRARARDHRRRVCHVVYDGVGKATFPASLDCLKPFGMFVSFGNGLGTHRAVRHHPAVAEGLALRGAADPRHAYRESRDPRRHGEGSLRRRRLRRGEDPGASRLPLARRRRRIAGSRDARRPARRFRRPEPAG